MRGTGQPAQSGGHAALRWPGLPLVGLHVALSGRIVYEQKQLQGRYPVVVVTDSHAALDCGNVARSAAANPHFTLDDATHSSKR